MASSGVSYWEEQKMLLVADVHLGKISHFRNNGSAVPQQAIQVNFERLTAAINRYKPQKLVFLGDLFHSVLNSEWILFENWIKNQQLSVTLIAGNHDVISLQHYLVIKVEVFESLTIDKFRLTHHPEEQEGFFNICGHIHPGYRLTGFAKQFLKLKCFYKSENRLILPAFGEFTGCFLINPTSKDQVYVCTENEVIQVK